MKLKSVYSILSAVTFGVPVLVGTASAGDLYQSTIVEAPAASGDAVPVNTSDFHLLKPGNLMKVTPSKNPGEAVTMQLVLKNVDCVAEGNDGAKAGKCGVAAHNPNPAVPVHAVLDMSVHQYILFAISGNADLMHVAGVPISFSKGVATIDASGKNKATGSAVFGALVGAFTNQKAGFHVTLVRTKGSDPANVTTGCGVTPLPPGNTCLDGTEFGLTGITTGPS